jgi:hypothetical protein
MWLVLAAAVFALQQAHGHQAPPASSALVEVAKRCAGGARWHRRGA